MHALERTRMHTSMHVCTHMNWGCCRTWKSFGKPQGSWDFIFRTSQGNWQRFWQYVKWTILFSSEAQEIQSEEYTFNWKVSGHNKIGIQYFKLQVGGWKPLVSVSRMLRTRSWALLFLRLVINFYFLISPFLLSSHWRHGKKKTIFKSSKVMHLVLPDACC